MTSQATAEFEEAGRRASLQVGQGATVDGSLHK